MALATVAVNGKVLRPDGGPATAGSLLLELMAPGSALDGATWQRIGGAIWVAVGTEGTVAFDLMPNDVLTPAGTLYRATFIQETAGRRPTRWVEFWRVDSSPNPISVGAIPRLDPEGTAVFGRQVSVPATATSPGAPGDFAADATWAYFCVALNTWRRVAVASW